MIFFELYKFVFLRVLYLSQDVKGDKRDTTVPHITELGSNANYPGVWSLSFQTYASKIGQVSLYCSEKSKA